MGESDDAPAAAPDQESVTLRLTADGDNDMYFKVKKKAKLSKVFHLF
jgi:hypothetical protein